MPQTEMLQRGEGQIAYDDAGGSGRIVICVPGMGALRSIYRLVVPKLRNEGFRVVPMDVRGMGESSTNWNDYSETEIASDVVAIIQKLHAGPVIIVGNSISAGAAVCVAADRPDLVSGLVLVAPFVRQVPIPWWKALTLRIALAGPWGLGTWVNYQSKNLYPKSKPPDISEYNLSLRKNLQEPGRMRGFRRMAKTNHRAAESRLNKVHCPVLVVMGSSDPDFPDPRAEGELIANKLHGELSLLPGLGHYPQAEDPDMFLDPVLQFLRGKQNGA